jgi:hypothetical protein
LKSAPAAFSGLRQPPLPALGADVELFGGGKQRALRYCRGRGGGRDLGARLGAVAELRAQELAGTFRGAAATAPAKEYATLAARLSSRFFDDEVAEISRFFR